ncbi:sugar ABC transporter permease, partial [Kribbella turkmenica]
MAGNTRWFWIFVGPFVIGLLIFSYLPIVWSLVLSFFEAYNTVTPSKFVGLQNYVDMLTDQAFLSSLGTFTIFAVFIVPLTFALSLALALLVNQVK